MIGRSEELGTLKKAYDMDTSSVCILYGRQGIGKTMLLREYAKDKNAIWFCCLPGSAEEQKRRFIEAAGEQRGNEAMSSVTPEDSFLSLLAASVRSESGKAVLIIEEFESLVKASGEFIRDIAAFVHNGGNSVKLQVILATSSVYFVENNLVSVVGEAAVCFNDFIKLREFSFVETVRMFPNYGVKDTIKLYAITGGVPKYLACFHQDRSLRENIISQIVDEKGPLHLEGIEYLKGETRETEVFNTVLSAMASGREKLNDIYHYTKYGRDKISVYIKSLVEREIVEKVFSYDSMGYANSKKGMYRIRNRFVAFWYRFIYRHYSLLRTIDKENFYDQYIDAQLNDYASDAFIGVAMEYLELMGGAGRLPFAIEKCGSWYGKDGNIDIICEDGDGRYLVGKTNFTDEPMTGKEYEKFFDTLALAEIEPSYVYLFSLGGFDEELERLAAEKKEITLIGTEDL